MPDLTCRSFDCGSCGREIRTYSNVGEKASCKFCGRTFIVPVNVVTVREEHVSTTEQSKERIITPRHNFGWEKGWGTFLQIMGFIGVICTLVIVVPQFGKHYLIWIPVLIGGLVGSAVVIAIGIIVTLQVEIVSTIKSKCKE